MTEHGAYALALDPGNQRSAIIGLHGASVLFTRHDENLALRTWIDDQADEGLLPSNAVLVIEQVASMGMAVGESVFETVFWSGRFAEMWVSRGLTFARLTRRAVKLAICNSARATDANIRQRLLDVYGGPDVAVGRKSAPGPLYGVKADLWAALALGLAYQHLKGIDVGLEQRPLLEER